MKSAKTKDNITFYGIKFLIVSLLLFFACNTSVLYSQFALSQASYSGDRSDNLIVVNKNGSYVMNIQVSRETLVNISLFDESDELVEVIFCEYVKPGKLEYDLAKHLPNGNFKCRIMIGEDTEVLRLLVI